MAEDKDDDQKPEDCGSSDSHCSSVVDIDHEMRKAMHCLFIAIDEDVARDVRSKVEAAIDWRDAEIVRLKAGRLTAEEFHELCHNLHLQGRPITEEEFDAGCKAEKFKLFHFDPTKAKPCSAFEEMKRQIHEEAIMPICNNPMDDGDRIVDGIR